MYRKRLRVKTGCHQCRQRRKKCDEVKPICGACRRLGYSCTWPISEQNAGCGNSSVGSISASSCSVSSSVSSLASASSSTGPCNSNGSSSSSSSSAVARRPLVPSRPIVASHGSRTAATTATASNGNNSTSVVGTRRTNSDPRNVFGNGVAPFTDQTQCSFFLGTADIYKAFISPVAGGQFRNLKIILTASNDDPLIRHALAAFSGYMLSARTGNSKAEQAAVVQYQAAVQKLQILTKRGTTETAMTVVLAATFLGLIEGLGTGNAAFGVSHFALVARLSKTAFARYRNDAGMLTLYRMVLEDVVYNLAYGSLVYGSRYPLDRLVDWEEYERVFAQGQGEETTHPYQRSPHFGGNHEFYRLMLEVTSFDRQCEESVREVRVGRWLSQIDSLEARLHIYYDGASPSAAKLYQSKYFLHALALRIYCLKIRDSCPRVTGRDVASLLAKARKILSAHFMMEPYNPALEWPLIVFLCASVNTYDFQFFIGCIRILEANFRGGPLKRLKSVIEAVNAIRRGEHYHCSTSESLPVMEEALSTLLPVGGGEATRVGYDT